MVTMEERTSKLEGAYEQVDERLGDIRVEMRGLRSDVNRRIGGVEGRIEGVEGRIEGLRGEMNGRIDETNSAIEGVRTELNGRIESLQTETGNRMNVIETRLTAIFIGMMAVGGGILAALIGVIVTLWLNL